MAVPKITEDNNKKALKYIDVHGVPFHNESTVYTLVSAYS